MLKLLIIFAVLFVTLSFMFNVLLPHVIALSLIIAIVSFVVSDFFILPAFENWGATIANFFLIVIAIRTYGLIFLIDTLPSLGMIGLIALVLSIGLFFYHIYVDRRILNVIEVKNELKMQTEFSEELKEKKK